MAEVHVLDHPLIQHKLAILRSKDTPVKEFRELVGEIAGLMCYEATRKLPLKEVEVETPVATAKCRMLSGKKLAIVPVLRAGLGMVDQMVALFALGGFALLYQLYGGLKAVAMTDIVQVTLLVTGGLIISGLTLNEVSGGQGIWAGFNVLLDQTPEKFNMILEQFNPLFTFPELIFDKLALEDHR